MYGNLGASIESLASQCGGATAPGKLAEIIKTAVTVTSTVNPGETSTSEEASGNAITLSEGALSAGGDDAQDIAPQCGRADRKCDTAFLPGESLAVCNWERCARACRTCSIRSRRSGWGSPA